MKKSVVILSGGMDSTTVLYQAIRVSEEVHAITMLYGQKHSKEVNCARNICNKLGVVHKIVELPFMSDLCDSSSLIGSGKSIPEGHYEAESMKDTIVPNGNMIFLSVAASYAINISAGHIWCGVHSGDHAIYPDCRPEFISFLERAIKSGNNSDVSIVAPYLHSNKKDILEEGAKLGVPYGSTWTCYNGREKSCGKCGSCQERLEAFRELGIVDPLGYEDE